MCAIDNCRWCQAFCDADFVNLYAVVESLLNVLHVGSTTCYDYSGKEFVAVSGAYDLFLDVLDDFIDACVDDVLYF